MNLSGVVRILFRDKYKYKQLSHEEKEEAFFVINRRMAKYSICNAELLNQKQIDMSLGLDVWFDIMSNSDNVPFDFWDGLKNIGKRKDILEGLSIKDKFIITNYFKEEYDEYIKSLKPIKNKIIKKKRII